MTAMPYMPFYVAHYLADTAHLDALEHGAYMLLIMNYWQRGKPLPADDERLRRTARVPPEAWPGVRAAIAEFFDVVDGEWRHRRIDAELKKVADRSTRLSAAGKRSGEVRTNKEKQGLTEPVFNTGSNKIEPVLNHIGKKEEEKKEREETHPESQNPSPAVDRKPKKLSIESKFDAWWDLFPNKIGKGACRRKFFEIAKAKPDGVTYEQIMAGLRRYVAKTDDRPWCQPLTWLNQGRWTDEPNDGKAPKVMVTTRPAEQREISEMDWRIAIENWVKTATWPVKLGKPPNEVGCKAPAALVAEYKIAVGEMHPEVRRVAEQQARQREEVRRRIEEQRQAS